MLDRIKREREIAVKLEAELEARLPAGVAEGRTSWSRCYARRWPGSGRCATCWRSSVRLRCPRSCPLCRRSWARRCLTALASRAVWPLWAVFARAWTCCTWTSPRPARVSPWVARTWSSLAPTSWPKSTNTAARTWVCKQIIEVRLEQEQLRTASVTYSTRSPIRHGQLCVVNKTTALCYSIDISSSFEGGGRGRG